MKVVCCSQNGLTREIPTARIKFSEKIISLRAPCSSRRKTREFSLSSLSTKKRAPRIHFCREMYTQAITQSRLLSLKKDLESLAIMVSTSFRPMVLSCRVRLSGSGLPKTRPSWALSQLSISKKPTSTSARALAMPPSKTQIFSKVKPEEHRNNPAYRQIRGQTSPWTTAIVQGRKQMAVATAWFAPRGACSSSSSSPARACAVSLTPTAHLRDNRCPSSKAN